jgi:hypothetical protein
VHDELTSFGVDLYHTGELIQHRGMVARGDGDLRAPRFDQVHCHPDILEPHRLIARFGDPDDVADRYVLWADRSIGELQVPDCAGGGDGDRKPTGVGQRLALERIVDVELIPYHPSPLRDPA